MKTYLTISTLAFAGCATQNLTPAQQAAVDKLTNKAVDAATLIIDAETAKVLPKPSGLKK